MIVHVDGSELKVKLLCDTFATTDGPKVYGTLEPLVATQPVEGSVVVVTEHVL